MSMLDSDAEFGAIVCAKMGQLLEQQFATPHIVRVSGIVHLLDQGRIDRDRAISIIQDIENQADTVATIVLAARAVK